MAGTKKRPDEIKICITCGNPFTRVNYESYEVWDRRVSCGGKCRTRPIAPRFWRRVDRTTNPEGCWEWTGGKYAKTGYGAFWLGTNNVGAHRMAFVLTHGEVPEGKYVLHTCDNRGCCNPKHLYAGTPQNNMDDRSDRGRCNAARGSRRSRRLKEEDIPVIVQRWVSGECARTIAESYGVTFTCVRLIVTGRNWPHVPRKTYRGDSHGRRWETGEIR